MSDPIPTADVHEIAKAAREYISAHARHMAEAERERTTPKVSYNGARVERLGKDLEAHLLKTFAPEPGRMKEDDNETHPNRT